MNSGMFCGMSLAGAYPGMIKETWNLWTDRPEHEPGGFTPENIEPYLSHLLGAPVRVLELSPLGEGPGQAGVKGYGYGVPL